LIARTVFDGATNGLRFRAYVTDTLAPVLKPGDTVILGNLNAHKVAGVREAIEAVGARVLYLPPYSPDFNPIEQVFAEIKALLRTAAARTAANLTTAIENAFAAVRPDECRNYLAAAGYDAYEPTCKGTALGVPATRCRCGCSGDQRNATVGNLFKAKAMIEDEIVATGSVFVRATPLRNGFC
jgi:transposase